MLDDDNADYLRLPIYRDGLSKALGFDDADLGANRAGRLGDGERRVQVHQLVKTFAGTSLVVALALLFGFLVARVHISARTEVNAVLATGASVFAAGYFGWYGIRLFLDVRTGEVRWTEGLVKPSERETFVQRTPIWTYYWNVEGGQRFAVTGKAYGALSPGRHRVYYLPRSRRVIAAEPI